MDRDVRVLHAERDEAAWRGEYARSGGGREDGPNAPATAAGRMGGVRRMLLHDERGGLPKPNQYARRSPISCFV